MKGLAIAATVFLLLLLALTFCDSAGRVMGAFYSHLEARQVHVVWVEPPHSEGAGL